MALARSFGIAILLTMLGCEDMPSPKAPSGPKGHPHDFDYFAGGWTTQQHKLKKRGVGSQEWEDFPATLCMTPYLDGLATVDELIFPTKGWSGLTLRAFDTETQQWSIYWLSSRRPVVESPVRGGFDGNRGEFYGTDTDDGKPVDVKFEWTKIDQDHAKWAQSFRYRGSDAWEVNWTADFTRAPDTAAICGGGAGRPRVGVTSS